MTMRRIAVVVAVCALAAALTPVAADSGARNASRASQRSAHGLASGRPNDRVFYNTNPNRNAEVAPAGVEVG
jgi:hypothetical protein